MVGQEKLGSRGVSAILFSNPDRLFRTQAGSLCYP